MDNVSKVILAKSNVWSPTIAKDIVWCPIIVIFSRI